MELLGQMMYTFIILINKTQIFIGIVPLHPSSSYLLECLSLTPFPAWEIIKLLSDRKEKKCQKYPNVANYHFGYIEWGLAPFHMFMSYICFF